MRPFLNMNKQEKVEFNEDEDLKIYFRWTSSSSPTELTCMRSATVSVPLFPSLVRTRSTFSTSRPLRSMVCIRYRRDVDHVQGSLTVDRVQCTLILL